MMAGRDETGAAGFDQAEAALTRALEGDAQAASVSTRRQILFQRLSASRSLAITLVAVALFVFFSFAADNFLTQFNLTNILRNASLIGIVAVGMTFVLIAGEIDISVGSVFGFLGYIMAMIVVTLGVSPWLAMIAVIALGAVLGTINGLIVTKLAIPSFVVTLAMLVAYRSGVLIISDQRALATGESGLFFDVTGGDLFFLPWIIIWMVAIMIIGGAILARTKYGAHVYATGGNTEAAHVAGVPTIRIKVSVFAVTGALCGLVGALLFGALYVGEPTTGTGFEFRVIGAVIVGGVALTGGRGSVYGSFVGAIIISTIASGLVLLGFSSSVGDIATGALIVGAAALDRIVRRSAARRLGALG